MKQATVTVTYHEEKIEALKMYLKEKDTNLDDELISAINSLYTKYVPSAVKDYIEKKIKAANSNHTEVKENGQHRSPSAVQQASSQRVKKSVGEK